jgi:hypothetical protein
MTRRVAKPRPRVGKEGHTIMSDETNNPWTSTGTPGTTPPNPEASSAGRAGFCQDCGRPLTQATIRTVGTGVFCEPCLTARVAPPTPTPGYTTVPPYTAAPQQPLPPGEPSPGLAFLLGLIPGVGAMYNGQFAKGIVHLIIFAILVSLASNVSDIFGIFVFGWILYMAFEAHHTAKARLEGLPLPNAFGLNDVGERMGFGKTWAAAGTVKPGSGPGYTYATAAAPETTPTPGYVPDVSASVSTTPDWIGYVPPTAFAGNAAQQQQTMAAQIREQALRDAGYYASQTPYSQTPYAQNPYAQTYSGVPPAAAVPTPVYIPEIPAKRFPVGAFWLIGLGLLILLANLIPDWKMSGRWWPPILFAGLSTWIFTRRLRTGVPLICIIRWPLILMVLAVMLALHAAYVPVTFGLTCSVLLIVFGALLLLERTAGATPSAVYPTSYSVVPPSDPSPSDAVKSETEAAQSRAAWTDQHDSNATDTAKGGQ